ncbi:hypothetical protein RDI58_024040 [Solanum bulbocastanum]|uniref:MADS-box domain-containing protein n=1 Tax=Solanum bulbocastanum TaxID=147425 RepID=A0AAN8T447_SOLBU
MGTGKKKIEIEKIIKETSRMVTFSKRRKGLFKKAKELESMTGSRVASVVFSPTGRPYTCGDVDSAIKQHFSSTRGLNSHDSNSDSDNVVFDGSLGSKSSSTPKRNGLRCWVEDVNLVQEDEKFQLELRILNLEGEIASLRHKERCLDDKRSEALNKILDIKEDVFAEVEPIIRSAFDGHNEGITESPGIIPHVLQELFILFR